MATGTMTEDPAIRVILVDDPPLEARALFARAFDGHSIPDSPRHYVAFCPDTNGEDQFAGYCHATWCGEYALMGGLCVNPDFRHKGVGHALERVLMEDTGPNKAFFSHTGNPTVVRMNARLGMEHSGYPNLMVKWTQDLSGPEKARILKEVHEIGPF